jgi:hypothetical protein
MLPPWWPTWLVTLLPPPLLLLLLLLVLPLQLLVLPLLILVPGAGIGDALLPLPLRLWGLLMLTVVVGVAAVLVASGPPSRVRGRALMSAREVRRVMRVVPRTGTSPPLPGRGTMGGGRGDMRPGVEVVAGRVVMLVRVRVGDGLVGLAMPAVGKREAQDHVDRLTAVREH